MIPNHNYLIVSVVSPNHTDVISELSRASTQYGCNLLNIEVNTLGTELSAVFFLSGNWGAIAKMEAAIPALEQRLDLTTIVRRTSEPPLNGQWMSYSLQLVAIDRIGILNGLSDFLSKMSIPIEHVSAHTYTGPSNTQMVSMILKIKVSDKMHLASLREKLMSYCDDNNLDAFIEPARH